MSKRRRTYFTYLESGHWRSLRRAAFNRDGWKCTQCGSEKRLRGHHLHYRKNLRDCTLKDIVTLCDKCHSKLHKEKNAQRRQRRKERAVRTLLALPIEMVRSVRWDTPLDPVQV